MGSPRPKVKAFRLRSPFLWERGWPKAGVRSEPESVRLPEKRKNGNLVWDEAAVALRGTTHLEARVSE